MMLATGQDDDHKLQPGIYQIFNFVSDTAIDLSGGDRKSIIGFPAHDGANQKWELSLLGKGYSIRSLYTGGYLTIEDGICNGTPIVASPYPVSWALEVDDLELGTWRIVWPGTRFLFDLAGKGDSKPCTPIQLWERHPFEHCRRWRFVLQQVPTLGPAIDPRSPENVPHGHRSPVSSQTETGVKFEESKLQGNGQTIITTTTTTTTTTVTKVEKINCS
ncbi:putative ricin-type beta-trefoil [Lyophyllum shimeji]|uniref:Ricin-type beta-trefoil n=1 Tax=Lyophyllum shimeji TaxID=47721 RepID=A0A9P3PTR9_LYOSH|nr:putative ricin-type beta-trefoil [Lyophyllum shimeji]